jgi:hypothetical protein
MRKYRTVFNFYFISFSPLNQIQGKSSGKHYFIGCSNWSDGDGLSHRFTTGAGRVWSNKATREAFVVVWNGIFEAIKLITGKSFNFKVFSKKSSLLDVIDDSEGAQAQGFGDVIILRQMNTPHVNGVPTVTVDPSLEDVPSTL